MCVLGEAITTYVFHKIGKDDEKKWDHRKKGGKSEGREKFHKYITTTLSQPVCIESSTIVRLCWNKYPLS